MSAGQTIILTGERARIQAARLVVQAPDGAMLTIKPPTRTPDQNAKMWAMLSDISRAKPGDRVMTPDLWKAVMMQACGHEVQFLEGVDGHPFPHGFRSSRLSKDQMGELISFIDAWGTENGVQWSNEGEQQ